MTMATRGRWDAHFQILHFTPNNLTPPLEHIIHGCLNWENATREMVNIPTHPPRTMDLTESACSSLCRIDPNYGFFYLFGNSSLRRVAHPCHAIVNTNCEHELWTQNQNLLSRSFVLWLTTSQFVFILRFHMGWTVKHIKCHIKKNPHLQSWPLSDWIIKPKTTFWS